MPNEHFTRKARNGKKGARVEAGEEHFFDKWVSLIETATVLLAMNFCW